jgi:hypothetical protein
MIARSSRRAVLAGLATVSLLSLSSLQGAAGRSLAPAADPGALPQTAALPSALTPVFRARMRALWRGIVTDSLVAAKPAFFPRAAYLQVKQIGDAGADYDERLIGNFRLDISAAHELLGAGAASAKLLRVEVPRQWAWIPPGYCYNLIGYWHAPGSRLVYESHGQVRSFGIFSLISWRGEWYVVHLGVWNEPGTLVDPAGGVGAFGPAGGC